MFGDHHVVEVRRLLLEIPGVADVYASSGFRVVEVQYDETSLKAEEIEAKLGEAGYLGELPVPAEKGAAVEQGNGDKPFFRHTAAYEQTGKTVGFSQNIPFAGRPLWPCPGMGPIRNSEEEMSYG
jgi:hypothetical protein